MIDQSGLPVMKNFAKVSEKSPEGAQPKSSGAASGAFEEALGASDRSLEGASTVLMKKITASAISENTSPVGRSIQPDQSGAEPAQQTGGRADQTGLLTSGMIYNSPKQLGSSNTDISPAQQPTRSKAKGDAQIMLQASLLPTDETANVPLQSEVEAIKSPSSASGPDGQTSDFERAAAANAEHSVGDGPISEHQSQPETTAKGLGAYAIPARHQPTGTLSSADQIDFKHTDAQPASAQVGTKTDAAEILAGEAGELLPSEGSQPVSPVGRSEKAAQPTTVLPPTKSGPAPSWPEYSTASSAFLFADQQSTQFGATGASDAAVVEELTAFVTPQRGPGSQITSQSPNLPNDELVSANKSPISLIPTTTASADDAPKTAQKATAPPITSPTLSNAAYFDFRSGGELAPSAVASNPTSVAEPLLGTAPRGDLSEAKFAASVLSSSAVQSRADAAMALTPTAVADARTVAHQISQALIRMDGSRVEVTLDPVELGRVSLTFVTKDEGVSVVVAADRAETADLLRRNSDQLQRDLANAGYENVDLDFDQSDQEATSRQRNETSETTQPAQALQVSYGSAINPAGLDIRL